VFQEGGRAERPDPKRPRRGDGVGWPVAPGTVGTVLEDWAIDEDACDDDRGILIKLTDGPHRGDVVLVERIYLRRGP
jgi:hypothetical protein